MTLFPFFLTSALPALAADSWVGPMPSNPSLLHVHDRGRTAPELTDHRLHMRRANLVFGITVVVAPLALIGAAYGGAIASFSEEDPYLLPLGLGAATLLLPIPVVGLAYADTQRVRARAHLGPTPGIQSSSSVISLVDFGHLPFHLPRLISVAY